VLAERRAALKREEGARRRGEARLAQELAFRDRLLANLANLAAGKQQQELSMAAVIQGHPSAPFGARHDAAEGKAWRVLMEGIAVKVRRPLMSLADEPR
jgi:hypothetical protein